MRNYDNNQRNSIQSQTVWREELLHFAIKSCCILRQKLFHLGLMLHFASKVVTFLVNVTFCGVTPSTTPRGKRPLLIPDFVSSLPVVLEEDRETVLGGSGGTQIILKTSHEKKPPLNNITFPQWSAANFRIMHTLVKEGAL